MRLCVKLSKKGNRDRPKHSSVEHALPLHDRLFSALLVTPHVMIGFYSKTIYFYNQETFAS